MLFIIEYIHIFFNMAVIVKMKGTDRDNNVFFMQIFFKGSRCPITIAICSSSTVILSQTTTLLSRDFWIRM